MGVGLRVEALRYSYGPTPVLKGVELAQIKPGQVTAILGPNASGKSTLLKCLAGLLAPAGRIVIERAGGAQVAEARMLRDLVTYLPQEYPSTAALTVFEAVLLATQRSASWFVTQASVARVADVLDELGLAELALRYLNELSGGQRQLVAVAQAIARDPEVLGLDEPTSSLDLQHQLELLSLVRALAESRQMTVLIALHDLNLAARFADQLVVLHDGQTLLAGAAPEVVTGAMLRQVYGVEARVGLDADGLPQVTPLRSTRSLPHA